MNGDSEDIVTTGGKWEDEEERRFFEDVQDLKDFVPTSVLGVEGDESDQEETKEVERERVEREKEEVRKLEEELEKLSGGESQKEDTSDKDIDDDEYVYISYIEWLLLTVQSLPTPTPGTPKAASPPLSPQLAPQGPSQLLTALMVRLPDATNRALIDQAAIDFAFLNSKAARKRLIRVSHWL